MKTFWITFSQSSVLHGVNLCLFSNSSMTAIFAQFGFLSNIQFGDNLEVNDHIFQTFYHNANQATIGHST